MGLFASLFGINQAVEKINCNDLQNMINNSCGIQLIDVREDYELNQTGWIPGAIHIPMSQIPLKIKELKPEKETVVYCAHGIRSYDAASFLADRDFKNVKSLSGGISRWKGKLERE